MNARTLRVWLLVLPAVILAGGLFAQTPQISFPAASPPCTLTQRVGLTDITVVYSRPSAKDRTIFGGIVPYGQVWRTGANQATKLTFSTPVKLEGHAIPAGNYALFAIPREHEWTIILNTNVNQWGAFQYNQKEDFVRFNVVPVALEDTRVETFAIEFDHIREESALIDLVWDKTVVPTHLTVDVSSYLVPQIEAAMAAPGKKPVGLYFQAANYYYNHDLDLAKALAWVNARLEENPPVAFEVLYLKAQILAKQGDKAGAIAAAKQSSDQAVKAEGPGSSFVKMNQDLISGLGSVNAK